MHNHKETRSVEVVANDLKEWFNANHPDYAALLNPGASQDDLSTLKEFFDNRIPEEVIEFYRHVNGQSDLDRPILLNGYVLLPASEVIKTWKTTKASMEIVKINYRLDKDFGPIKGYIQNLNWIPIASNIAGDLYCIDLEPSEAGSYGQIIRVVKDDINLKQMGDSFKDFLGCYETALKSGKVIFSEEYQMFINPGDDEYLN